MKGLLFLGWELTQEGRVSFCLTSSGDMLALWFRFSVLYACLQMTAKAPWAWRAALGSRSGCTPGVLKSLEDEESSISRIILFIFLRPLFLDPTQLGSLLWNSKLKVNHELTYKKLIATFVKSFLWNFFAKKGFSGVCSIKYLVTYERIYRLFPAVSYWEFVHYRFFLYLASL